MHASYSYPRSGLGPLLYIPWIALLTALFLAFILFARPIPIVPSTLPAGYFALLLALVTTIYFFRYDWYRRQQFDTADAGLTVVSPRGKRDMTPWADFLRADYHTNTGALVLRRPPGRRALVLYPASLERGAALIAAIDARTTLGLATIPDLQAALQRTLLP